MDNKVEYEAPTLLEVGSFEAITKMQDAGANLDDGFVAGTPLADLTLS